MLRNIYEQNVNHTFIEEDIQDLGVKLRTKLGLDYPYLDKKQSKFTLDLYQETIKLTNTYLR